MNLSTANIELPLLWALGTSASIVATAFLAGWFLKNSIGKTAIEAAKQNARDRRARAQELQDDLEKCKQHTKRTDERNIELEIGKANQTAG